MNPHKLNMSCILHELNKSSKWFVWFSSPIFGILYSTVNPIWIRTNSIRHWVRDLCVFDFLSSWNIDDVMNSSRRYLSESDPAHGPARSFRKRSRRRLKAWIRACAPNVLHAARMRSCRHKAEWAAAGALPGSPATITGPWRTRRIFAIRLRISEGQTLLKRKKE